MCQWKLLVFRYNANTSASIAFMPPAISIDALSPRSVGVISGAFRRRTRSSLLRVWDCLACIPDTYGIAFEAADETLCGLNPRRAMMGMLRFEQICANEASWTDRYHSRHDVSV